MIFSARDRVDTSDSLRLKVHSSCEKERYLRRIKVRSVENSLELLILLSADKRPLSGYEVMSCILSKFGILLSPGTVYPIMKRLEKMGFLTATTEGQKKTYSPTTLGKLTLEYAIEEYEQVQRNILSHLLSYVKRKAT